MNLKEKIIKEYQTKELVDNFDETRSEFIFNKKKHEYETEILNRILKAQKSTPKVLDVACGTGRLLKEVLNAQEKIDYIGLDTSKQMVAKIKERKLELKKEQHIKFVIAEANKMPFSDNKFDVTYTYHLLWHLTNAQQEEIIKEMIRVTKPEGIILIDILNKAFIWERIKKVFNVRSDPTIYKFSKREIKNLITPNKILRINKLLDPPIKSKKFYFIIEILNKLGPILPKFLFHIFYIKIKKNKMDKRL